MLISNRISEFKFSPIRKLTPLADAAKKRGVKVHHLNIGQPDIKTPIEVYDYFKSMKPGVVAYGVSEGEPELRRAYADYFKNLGLDIDFEDIMITTGGSEALLFLFMVLCEPGSEAIVTEPFYTNVQSFAKMAMVNLVPVTSSFDDGFALPSMRAFEKAINPRTSLIMINSPNNPTGHIYSPEEITGLLELCRKHDLTLVVDEVYREFCYDGMKFTSVLSYPEYQDRVVCVDSFSKRFSMCGARVGALVSKNHEFLNQCLKLGQARLCPPVFEERAATAALSAPASYVEDVRKMYESRRNCVVSELRGIPGVKCSNPQGAFYLVAELPVDDAEAFCAFLLKDFSYEGQTVMLAPANGFYINSDFGKHQVRIAYVLNEADIKAAMVCLAKGIEAYNSRAKG